MRKNIPEVIQKVIFDTIENELCYDEISRPSFIKSKNKIICIEVSEYILHSCPLHNDLRIMLIHQIIILIIVSGITSIIITITIFQ